MPTFSSSERGGVRPVHGPGPHRRPRPRARSLRVDPINEFKHTRVPRLASARRSARRYSERRADVGHRSDHVGGREGPRASLRLLQPDDPRPRARRRAPAAHVGARSSAIPRLGQRVVAAPLRIVPPEFADDPDARPRLPHARVAVPGAGRRPRAPRPLRRARRAAARPVAAAVGVHADRRARRRPRRAAPEDPPHDHRRRRRPEALARVRRLRARPRPARRDPDRPATPTDGDATPTGTRRSTCYAARVGDVVGRTRSSATPKRRGAAGHVITHPPKLPASARGRVAAGAVAAAPGRS